MKLKDLKKKVMALKAKAIEQQLWGRLEAFNEVLSLIKELDTELEE